MNTTTYAMPQPAPEQHHPRHLRLADAPAIDQQVGDIALGPFVPDQTRLGDLGGTTRPSAPRHSRQYNSSPDWATTNPRGAIAEDAARRLAIIDRLNAAGRPQARPDLIPVDSAWDPMSDYHRRTSLRERLEQQRRPDAAESSAPSLAQIVAAAQAAGRVVVGRSRPYGEGRAMQNLTEEQQARTRAMQQRVASTPYAEIIADRTRYPAA